MKITAYNEASAIEMLRARMFLFIMLELEGPLPTGEHGSKLWEIVGHMRPSEAVEAIENFEATQ